jgi:KDO2-lipid IV(A) lauroyltransferase
MIYKIIPKVNPCRKRVKKDHPGIAIEIQHKIIYVDEIRTAFIPSRNLMLKTYFDEIKYWLGDFCGDLLLLSSITVLRVLPQKSIVLTARVVGTSAFCLIKKYRNRVMHNLSLVFGGEKDHKGIEKLAKDVFFNLILTPLEMIYAYTHPFEKLLLKIEIRGKEYLDSALAQGKGAIALGSHVGPFTLVGARLSLEGYPFNLIINQGNFPKVWKRLEDHQRRLGQNPFPVKPVRSSFKKSLNCLRRNEILYIVADERQRRGGIPVQFFGQTASTAPGPAIISLKTGAPILPMFVVREKGIPHTLFIGSPIKIELTGDEKKDTELLTARFTKAIEDIVRQYPSQWPWLNRRWELPSSKGFLDRTK